MMVVLQDMPNKLHFMSGIFGMIEVFFSKNMQIKLEFVFEIYEMVCFTRFATINFMEYL